MRSLLLLTNILTLLISDPSYAFDKRVIRKEKDFRHEVGEHRLENFKYELYIYHCLHQVNEGDTYLGLIRHYGYRSPFNIDLDDHSLVPFQNKIEPGMRIYIPVPIVLVNNQFLEEGLTCKELRQRDSEDPLIVKGKEASFRHNGEELKFFQGFSRDQLRKRGDLILDFRKVNSPKTDLKLKKVSQSRKIASIEKDEPREDESQGEFSLNFETVYDSIHDKKTSLILVSELQPRVSLDWIQNWTNHVFTFFDFGLTYKNYSPGNFNLQKRQLTQSDSHFGFGYRFSNFSLIKAKIGMKEQVLFERLSSSSYQLKKERLLHSQVEGEVTLLTKKKLSLGMLGLGDFSKSVYSGQLKSGFGYGAGIQINYRYRDQKSLKGKIQYKENQLKGGNLLFSVRDFRFGLQWSFDF